ncbi:hypothetical protein [Nocardioides sp. B-3]|uniref:hypothetical protein n=1 Tax=Nocardioides sp. B-3 TaxID=2895565 RepID=UPI003FA5EE29
MLAVLALVPRSTRVPVIVCWLVALAAAPGRRGAGLRATVPARDGDAAEPRALRGDPAGRGGDRHGARCRGLPAPPPGRRRPPDLAARPGRRARGRGRGRAARRPRLVAGQPGRRPDPHRAGDRAGLHGAELAARRRARRARDPRLDRHRRRLPHPSR